MKVYWKKALSVAVMMCVMAGAAWAEEIPMDVATIEKVMQLVNQKDYVGVRKVKVKNHQYFVEAFTEQGGRIKIYIDPQTLQIVEPQPESQLLLTVGEVAKKVEAAGFPKIYIIELQEQGYIVVASNSKRHKVRLLVNAKTGAVRDSIFNYLE